MRQKIVYNNVAQVYLEGKRALQPVEWETRNQVTYYLGDTASNIKINDRRPLPNLYAHKAIDGEISETFAESFSKPAKISIEELGNNIQIELDDPVIDVSEFPILWLGVFEGDRLSANPLDWYVLRETEDNRTAFVALVNPQR